MNVLKHFKKAALFTLLQNGVSQREIARNTHVDRKTIRKYQAAFALSGSSDPSESSPFGDSAASNSPMATGISGVATSQGPPAESAKPARSSVSACFAHHDWIVAEVLKGRNAMSIYQDLVELFAFPNRYNSVKRYVGRLRLKAPEQYDRLEFLPGEEAQVDYGEGAFTIYPKNGKRRRPRLFVMTLRYSRRSFRKVVWNSSKEVWAKLHEEAFRYFGGVPQYIVLDNLKEGVLKPDIYDPELNPVFAAMLQHYGAVADPCRVADPDRKGTVENAIQHTQDTALKGREFDTIEAQNEWLMNWEERWAAPRIHGRTKRQVQEMFLEEKPFLKALPLRGFRYFEEGTRSVQDDGLIEVHRVYYAASPAPIYSRVLVRIYETEIEIYNRETLELYRRHFINPRKGSINWEESDRIFNPSRETQYFLNQAERIGPKTKELCEILFTELGRVGHRVMRGIIGLTKKHAAELIEEAARQGIERRIRKSSTLRHMVENLEKDRVQEKQKQQELLPALTQKHELIRELSVYGGFFRAHTHEDFIKSESPLTQEEKNHAHVIH